ETRDSWSTALNLFVRVDHGLAFEGARLYEQNVLGTGHEASIFYFERDVTREYGLSLYSPQLAGTRWDFSGAIGRTRAGTFLREEVAYPFVGELGRWAGRQEFSRNDQFFDYVQGDDPGLGASHVLVPMREKAADVAVLRRIGRRGATSLIGLGMSYRETRFTGAPLVAPGGDFNDREPASPEIAALVEGQREAIEAVRFALLLGHRNIWWVQRRGLDSMRGLQDVRLGAELGLELARSITAF